MKHVVIIGAGVIGLCSADALLERGFRVTVLERDPAPGNGASYGNSGLIVPSHFEPLANPGNLRSALRMLRSPESPFGFQGWPGFETMKWMARFFAAATDAHVHRCAPILRDLNLVSRELYEGRYAGVVPCYERKGELMICMTARSLESEAALAKEAERLQVKTRILDAEALKEFETGIEMDASGAVYFEDDAHLTPRLFMDALRAKVIAAGGEVRYGTAVDDFQLAEKRIDAVKTGEEQLAADEFVIAAGAWTAILGKKLKVDLPMLSGRGYGFTVKDPPAMPNYPGILVDGRVAVTPMADGLRFGGTMELGQPRPRTVNAARLGGMWNAIRAAYPAFRDLELTAEVWQGNRPCTPDGMPYLGRLSGFDNLAVAAGHGMMGLSLGPVSGQLVGAVLGREQPMVPLELMDPNRFRR
jgi:D-amino-acid dehydrogenase